MTAPHLRSLNAGIASIWLLTGALVVFPYYRSVGAAYLAPLGLPAWLMVLTCAFELGLGLMLLWRGMTLPLAVIQLGMIGGFTLILAWSDPWLLVHPFGMLTKNLPLAAMIATAALVTRQGWTDGAWRLLRVGMALIWITEGLFPKILFQQASEVAVVANSGLSFGDPATFLAGLGAAQVLAGLAALTLPDRWRQWVLAGQLAGLTVLPLLVSWQDPTLWLHPFGPMTKNLPILVGTCVLYRQCRSSSS